MLFFSKQKKITNTFWSGKTIESIYGKHTDTINSNLVKDAHENGCQLMNLQSIIFKTLDFWVISFFLLLIVLDAMKDKVIGCPFSFRHSILLKIRKKKNHR